MNTTPEDLRTFEQAFDCMVSSCRGTCDCGKEFYDNYNEGIGWEEGEIEGLRADPNAIPLEYGVAFVQFEGRQFVMDCTCWHERARKILGFINGHARPIAKFLTLEKRRKQHEANIAAVVEGEPT